MYFEQRLTPCTAAELCLAYYEAIPDASAEQVAVLVSHGTLECGRDVKKGLIATSCRWFNLGNVKQGTWPDWCAFRLNEYLVRAGTRTLIWFSPAGEEVGGTSAKPGSIRAGTESLVPPGHVQCRMRVFESLARGVAEKIRFLQAKRFAAAWAAARAGLPGPYVDAIHAQGYFTADPAPYRAGVSSLYKTMLPVAQAALAGRSDAPKILSPDEEQHIELCIGMCRPPDLTSPEHVAAVQFDLGETIDFTRREA